MISIAGQLAIRTITGRNGPFNVGRLVTSIGEFVIMTPAWTSTRRVGTRAILQSRKSARPTTPTGTTGRRDQGRARRHEPDDVTNLSAEDEEQLSTTVPRSP
jgi:hypothetical protein